MKGKTVKWATPLVTLINENTQSNFDNSNILLKNIILFLILIFILIIVYKNCNN
jgi:hypothetical protein